MAFQLIDRIAVEDEGEGDAVVCVHGLGGTSNTWTPLAAALVRHRVVRIDLPGSGRSHAAMTGVGAGSGSGSGSGSGIGTGTGTGALSIERMADALQTVCARLGIARAHWLGHLRLRVRFEGHLQPQAGGPFPPVVAECQGPGYLIGALGSFLRVEGTHMRKPIARGRRCDLTTSVGAFEPDRIATNRPSTFLEYGRDDGG